MELNEFFTFSRKISQYVAKVRDQNIPDTVLLFEPRMSVSALRVTYKFISSSPFMFEVAFWEVSPFIQNFWNLHLRANIQM